MNRVPAGLGSFPARPCTSEWHDALHFDQNMQWHLGARVLGSWEARQVPKTASHKPTSHQDPGSHPSGLVGSGRHGEHHTGDTSDKDRDKTLRRPPNSTSFEAAESRGVTVFSPSSQGLLRTPGRQSHRAILHARPSWHGELLQAHCSLRTKAVRHCELHITANCVTPGPCPVSPHRLLICRVSARITDVVAQDSPNDSARDGPRLTQAGGPRGSSSCKWLVPC